MRAVRRGADAGELGFTLVEVLATSVLTMVVLGMGYGILNSATQGIQAASYQASNSTNARLALSQIEANLRYANGFWVSTSAGGGSITGPGSILTVSNSSATAFTGQPVCAQWTVGALGLYEAKDATGSTTLGTPALVMAGASAATFTSFAAPLSGLARVDLTVNQELRQTRDAVSVHELIAPDNLTTGQVAPGFATGTLCT